MIYAKVGNAVLNKTSGVFTGKHNTFRVEYFPEVNETMHSRIEHAKVYMDGLHIVTYEYRNEVLCETVMAPEWAEIDLIKRGIVVAGLKNVSLASFVGKRFYDIDDGWQTIDMGLSEDDIDDIVSIVGRRCRRDTKIGIRLALQCDLDKIENCGILERLQFDATTGWNYVAGQDYVAEVRTLRNVILGKK